MDKRMLFTALLALPFASVAAKAANVSQRNSATWKVPPGVKKIRVRSWNSDGSPDLDRTLNVEPNQVFRIDAIEN
jgi:hypothetical protein